MKNKIFSNNHANFIVAKISGEISLILQEDFSKKIWHLNLTDRYRLFKLWLWSQRYHVSISFILSVLLPYFSKGVEKRTGKKSKGLGVSIPVLTGDVAEEILQKAISLEFPEGDNVQLEREAEIAKITKLLEEEQEIGTRFKKSLHYRTIRQEVNSYIESIKKAKVKADKIEKKFSKIPFRNNPFR